jgi:hypothetical protein
MENGQYVCMVWPKTKEQKLIVINAGWGDYNKIPDGSIGKICYDVDNEGVAVTWFNVPGLYTERDIMNIWKVHVSLLEVILTPVNIKESAVNKKIKFLYGKQKWQSNLK